MLKKTFVLVLTLTIVYFAESSPVSVTPVLDFDNFGVDYPDVGYERDNPIWAPVNLLKLNEVMTRKATIDARTGKYDAESSTKASRSKEKNKSTKGVYSSGDLNLYSKNSDAYDHGDYYDADAYTKTAATAASAAVTKGKETRTYARGKNTTGFHRVHHKDEYKKDQDFYEKDDTKGTVTKAAANASGTTVNADEDFKTGSFKHDRQRGIHGKERYLDNGFSDQRDFSDSEDPAKFVN